MPANPSLDQALPELRAAEQRLRARASDNGITYALAEYGGLRTQADTNQIVAYRQADYNAAIRRDPRVARIPINTFRPIAPFGRSMHNWGSAFDIVITGAPPGWTRDKALAVLGAIAPTVGLRWGGTFPSDRVDPPHFELPTSVVDARARYLAYTGGKGYVGPSGPLDFLRRIFTPASAGAQQPVVSTATPTLVVPGISVTPSRVPDILSTIGPVTAAALPEESLPMAFPVEVTRQAPRSPRQPPRTPSVQGALPGRALPVRTDVSDVALYNVAQEAKRRQNFAIIAAVFVGAVVIVLLRQD